MRYFITSGRLGKRLFSWDQAGDVVTRFKLSKLNEVGNI